VLHRLREWWAGVPTTKQALIAACLGAAALGGTVIAIVVFDAPTWIVLPICVPAWVLLRLLRYQRSRST